MSHLKGATSLSMHVFPCILELKYWRVQNFHLGHTWPACSFLEVTDCMTEKDTGCDGFYLLPNREKITITLRAQFLQGRVRKIVL